jgi:hypothetical protein
MIIILMLLNTLVGQAMRSAARELSTEPADTSSRSRGSPASSQSDEEDTPPPPPPPSPRVSTIASFL